MRLMKYFHHEKLVWRKYLITVSSNPLVSDKLKVVGHEFAGWTRPPLTSVGRTLKVRLGSRLSDYGVVLTIL